MGFMRNSARSLLLWEIVEGMALTFSYMFRKRGDHKLSL